MNRTIVWALATAALVGGCTAQTKSGGPAVAATGIPFGAFGKIYDWRPEGNSGLFIESDSHQWYHATFVAPCAELSFAGHIDFRTKPPFPINNFNSIEIYDTDCYFKTFDPVSGPPAK